MGKLKGLALPTLSGTLLALSFPKADISVLAWAALVPLLYSIKDKGPSASFRDGFACGLVFYVSSIYWVINTMHNYGGLDLPVSVVLLVALSAYLALYVGAFAWLVGLARTRLGPAASLMAAPLFWVALELARNYLLTGFPWNLLGYSQHGVLSVIQISDMTGVYGVSALVVLVNAALFAALPGTGKLRPSRRAAPAAAAVLALAAALAYGHHRLSHPPAETGRLRVALVQGNIEQFHKWDPDFQGEVFGAYAGLTRQAAKARPDLIIWPETATPFYFQDKEDYPMLLGAARESGAYLLTGSPSIEPAGGGRYIEYNSAYLISPEGNPSGRYDKVHLVPFGEYVPLKRLLPFVSKMVAGIGDFGAGGKTTVLRAGRGSFGVAICFEVIFPELVRQFARGGADFLTSITNDAWFGDSAAPYQHFDMAVFRAVENRRALVRAANTGITGIIMPSGRVSARTGLFVRAVLPGEIPLVAETTFYTRRGDVFAYGCALATVLLLTVAMTRKRGGLI